MGEQVMKSIAPKLAIALLIALFSVTVLAAQSEERPSELDFLLSVAYQMYYDNDFLEEYDSLKASIARTQDSLLVEYKKANPQKKKAIIKQAREYIFDRLMNDIFPAWYGTSFGMYGTSEIPKHGKIACGYLVTTTLKHAGFQFYKVNGQDSMAMQTSENIILNLVSDHSRIKRYSDKPVSLLEKDIKKWGKGLYIVGMDLHAGFIANDGDSIRFIHVSYYIPQKALAEKLDGPNPLKNSGYRVVGKILDDEMIKKWLLKEKFELKYDYFRKGAETSKK